MKVCRIAFVAIIALTGCSKIHEKREFTVGAAESHSLEISAPLSEQKVKVTLTSDQPVNIYVLLDKDYPKGKDDFDPETLKTGIIASQKNAKEASLDATIPAKEKYRVIVGGATKQATVTVKIDSQ
jgi:hypothetical protein